MSEPDYEKATEILIDKVNKQAKRIAGLEKRIEVIQRNRNSIYNQKVRNYERIAELEAGQLDFAKEMTKIHKAKIQRIAELEAELEQHRWIPISERLPEDDSPHLFWLESGNVVQGIPSCELGKHNPPLTHKATHWKLIILPEQALKGE